jgi:hypothetical protein
MPTILRIGAARFFFYSNEGNEPPHIHIEQAGAIAKFWLSVVSLASSSGFRAADLRRLEQQVQAHREQFLDAWHDYFAT